ncbi:MAG: hypothetical protein ACJAYC_002091 [Halieaceae bacterium]|jgi:hypothetical protein
MQTYDLLFKKLCIFALLSPLLGATGAWAQPLAYAESNGNLYSVDLATGVDTLIGDLGITDEDESDVEALAVDPTSGTLYLAADDGGLYTVDTGSGAATLIGLLGQESGNSGMAIDGSRNIYLVTSDGLLSVDKTTGAATVIATDYDNPDTTGEGLSGGAFVGSTLYGSPDNDAAPNLYSIDVTTGKATTIGPLGPGIGIEGEQTGLTYDANTDTLYLLDEDTSSFYTVDYTTGAATLLSVFSRGFEGIALASAGNPNLTVPVPTLPWLALAILSGLITLVGFRRLRN